MKVQSLSDIYSSLDLQNSTVFVVPKIRYDFPDSDYLYLLYKPILDSESYQIKDISFFQHYKFVFKALTTNNTILHYHWLEFQDMKSLLGMPWKLLSILLFKILGGKVVWTIHNLSPHTGKWKKLHQKIHSWMAKISDKVHIHCEIISDVVTDKFKITDDKLCILPHPSFPADLIHKSETVSFLKSKYGIEINSDKPTILYFGNISEYKNIEESLETIENENLDVQVLIAGPVKKGQEKLGQRLKKRAQENENYFLIPDFIPDDQIKYFFGSADFCFFNFDKILTSGSVEMALSYKKNIIAPSLGCLAELLDDEKVLLFSSEHEKRVHLKTLTSMFNNE